MFPWIASVARLAGIVTRPSHHATDEDRLSMKGVARGKKKIANHTANAAQEMHRISTGGKFTLARERIRRLSNIYPTGSFSATNGARRPREIVNSQRVATEEQAVLFHEDRTRDHAGAVCRVNAVAARTIIRVIEVRQ